MRALKSKKEVAPRMPLRLAALTLKYGIPAQPYAPMGKNVLVYRLPTETVSAGGILLPQVWTERMEGTGNPLEPVKEIAARATPEPKGILVAAGLAALDILRDAAIEIGDVVYFGKYEGWEVQVSRDPENTGKDIIQMKVEGILGSADTLERVTGPKATHVVAYDEETGEHKYKEVR